MVAAMSNRNGTGQARAPVRTFIVTADDFGLSPAINSGIVEAHTSGIVTAASLMATGEAFEDAVDRARATPSLEIGVHLALDEETPLVDGIRTLTTTDGRFLRRGIVLRRLAARRVDSTEVERCWRAEIERCLASGIRPAFLNSHGHVHVLPMLLPIAVRLARDYRILAIRRPVEPPWTSRPATAGHALRALVVSSAALWSFAKVEMSDVAAVPAFQGLAASGRQTTARLRRELDRPGDCDTELMVHPGRVDEATRRRYGYWRYGWEQELEALLEVKVERSRLSTFSAELGT